MSTSEVNQCPEWCEAAHKIEKTGAHAKFDRCVMTPSVGLIFSNTYYETDSGIRVWVIRGVLGEIRFYFDESESDQDIKARYEKVFAMYQEVADARVATIEAQIKAITET